MARMLVIEDDLKYRELVRYLLRNKPFVIDEASDLKCGLACLSAVRYDIVLLDLALPDSDRHQTVKEVKGTHQGTLVVALTAYADPNIVAQVIADNAADCLIKGHDDIDESVLCMRLETAIKEHNTRTMLRDGIKAVKDE